MSYDIFGRRTAKEPNIYNRKNKLFNERITQFKNMHACIAKEFFKKGENSFILKGPQKERTHLLIPSLHAIRHF